MRTTTPNLIQLSIFRTAWKAIEKLRRRIARSGRWNGSEHRVNPRSRLQETAQVGLRAAGLRAVDAPAGDRRQRHEHGVGVDSGLQAEPGAAVIEQVELH